MTHKELFEKRQIIAEYLRNHTIKETSQKFKIKITGIYPIVKEFNVTYKKIKVDKLSYEKRQQIAEYLKTHLAKETQRKFKISLHLINKIKCEFNIPKFRLIHKGTAPNFQIIALIQNTNWSYITIANKINCTRQNVSFIAKCMRDNGIKFKERI